MWGRVPTALSTPVSVTLSNLRPAHAPLSLQLQTNRLARLAPASAVLTANDTTILATLAHPSTDSGRDTGTPLLVDFRAKAAAVGVIPATWTRREAQPTLSDILTARLIDRSVRPALAGLSDPPPVHLTVSVLSSTRVPDAPLDALAVNAAAAALAASDLALPVPLAAARVALVDGKHVPFPDEDALARADLSAFVAVNRHARVLAASLHTRAGPASERCAVDAFQAAAQSAAQIIPAMHEFRAAVADHRREHGRSSFPPRRRRAAQQPPPPAPDSAPEPPHATDDEAFDAARARFDTAFVACRAAPGKAHRAAELTAAHEELHERFPHIADGVFARAARAAFRGALRRDGVRVDGRAPRDVRALRAIAPALPGDVHGSALFERGDTQVLACATVGLRNKTRRLEEYVDGAPAGGSGGVPGGGGGLGGGDDFFVHYAFPPFATGEAGRYAGPSNRRETGHGALAERAIAPLLERDDAGDLTYALRVSADVLGSDGSSSMATVCAGSLALMDCGAPIREPVAGVAMGLVTDEKLTSATDALSESQAGDTAAMDAAAVDAATAAFDDAAEDAPADEIILADILGAEDHFGDMDMKVAGPASGLTACQMDTKRPDGLALATIARVLRAARTARATVLSAMRDAAGDQPRAMPAHAPRIANVPVRGEQTRLLLRDRAAALRAIQDATGARLTLDDRRGVVRVEASDLRACDAATGRLRDALARVEVGTRLWATVADVSKTYARVQSGSGGVSGILHVSKMQVCAPDGGNGAAVRSYPDARRVLSVGDEVEVVVLEAASEKGSMRVGLLAPPAQAGSKLNAEVDAVLAAVGKG